MAWFIAKDIRKHSKCDIIKQPEQSEYECGTVTYSFQPSAALFIDLHPIEVIKAFITEVLPSSDVIPTRSVAILCTFFRGLYETEWGVVTQTSVTLL